MQKFIQDIKQNAISYGSLPFWSWNDKLDPQILREQLRDMHKLGMNGAFMHARSGLETEYLSDEWYECIRQTVDEAEKLGMEAWSYDENGWPSGFAGGELLKDPANWATFLTHEVSDVYPTPPAPGTPPSGRMGVTNENDAILGVYVVENGVLRMVDGPVEGAQYHIIRQGYDSSYVDTTDAEITKKFIEKTHVEYKKRIGFSAAMPGFFTDEPQYYRWGTPWSNKMQAEFSARYGYDVMPMLAALFIDCEGMEEFRYDYYRLLHELFINHFGKVIYDWCDENGCQLTGHAIEEASLAGQMWSCAGIMPFYEYEHIPGIDYLSRNLANSMASRQLGSACAQMGKKKAMSEMFACCGWDVSPNELKNIAELQYAGGVNLMCQHLYPYSERGQRKTDYPAHYSEHLPWQESMADFNRYFNHLGYLLSRGEEPVDVLVIHPIHSAYLYYKRKEDGATIAELETETRNLIGLLEQNQVGFHFGDEWMMARHGAVEGSKLRIGNCSYGHIIVPFCYTLDGTTVEFLKAFIANGGKVWMYGKAPTRIDGRVADFSWLQSNCTWEDIMATTDSHLQKDGKNLPEIRQMIRKTEIGRVFYMTSLSHDCFEDVEVTLHDCKGVVELDLFTLETKPVCAKMLPNGDLQVTLTFEDSQSYVLVEAPEAAMLAEPVRPGKKIQLGAFTLAERPVNAMTLDFAEMSYDGVTYEKRRPIILIRDLLLRARYAGDLYLKYRFTVDELPDALRLCAEPLKYKSITVNGTEIALGQPAWLDRSFMTADLADVVKVGENEIVFCIDYWQNDYVYEVLYGGGSESLRNCLNFDTEIECCYLYGDFAVKTENEKMVDAPRDAMCYDGGFAIGKQSEAVDMTNLVKAGYPFFAGQFRAKTVYTYAPGDATELYVTGRFAVCDVYVNGAFVKKLMFDSHCDLSGVLQTGDNEIELRLYNANRNLLGPHHNVDPEPYGVSPTLFLLERCWDGEECRMYRERYAFVRFGIDG